MSRTYKRDYTSEHDSWGEHGSHNTLGREFRHCGGSYNMTIPYVKQVRSCYSHRRHCQSDRLGGLRRVSDKRRRTALKRFSSQEINEALSCYD